MYFLRYETFWYKNDSIYGSVSLDFFFLISPRNLDFFFFLLNFPYSHLLYSRNPFCTVFIFPGTFCSSPVKVLPSLTGFVLSSFQPVSLDGPAQNSVHSVLSWSSLPAVGSLCRGTDWPCREAEPAPRPTPPQNQPKQLLWWGWTLGKGQDHTGYFIRVFVSSFTL